MSTRAMILIKPNGSDCHEVPIHLYQHSDGYPEYVLPLIAKALETAKTPVEISPAREGFSAFHHDRSWKTSRPGYAATMLLCADPAYYGMQPCCNELHSDLEFVYLLDCNGGDWKVEVRNPTGIFGTAPTLANTRVLHKSQLVTKLAKRYIKDKQTA